MKELKIKYLIIAFLMFFLCYGVSIGKVQATNIGTQTKMSVNDFESIEDLYRVRMFAKFGILNLNEDKAFVTSGEKSMKLEVHGDYHVGTNPTVLELCFEEEADYDLKRLGSISFDVFNQTGADKNIKVCLKLDGEQTNYKDFLIKNGEKTAIKVDYDLQSLASSYDISKIEGICIMFPKALDRATQSQNIYYLDNFNIDMIPFPVMQTNFVLDGDEFCSFDMPYQEYIVSNLYGTGAVEGYRPELSINNNPLFCSDRDEPTFVYGVNKSLRVELPKSKNESYNPGFSFNPKLWHSFEWSEMNDKALVFDVYNDSESDFDFSIVIFRNPDNSRTGYYDRFGYSFNIPAYSWQTVRLSIKEWNESTKDTNGLPMTSNISRGEVVYTYQTPFFAYSGKSVGSVNRVFYFDNFRIEDL